VSWGLTGLLLSLPAFGNVLGLIGLFFIATGEPSTDVASLFTAWQKSPQTVWIVMAVRASAVLMALYGLGVLYLTAQLALGRRLPRVVIGYCAAVLLISPAWLYGAPIAMAACLLHLAYMLSLILCFFHQATAAVPAP
jgi:hypothetical protein